MLEEVRISGLGVIDEAVLELSPGLTVLTGETGAGKTMVVSGLSLLFGGYDAARYVHFLAMAAIVGFIVIHVVMALLVPKSLRAMIVGR